MAGLIGVVVLAANDVVALNYRRNSQPHIRIFCPWFDAHHFTDGAHEYFGSLSNLRRQRQGDIQSEPACKSCAVTKYNAARGDIPGLRLPVNPSMLMGIRTMIGRTGRTGEHSGVPAFHPSSMHAAADLIPVAPPYVRPYFNCYSLIATASSRCVVLKINGLVLGRTGLFVSASDRTQLPAPQPWGRRARWRAGSRRVQVELAHFIEQRLVADAQHFCGILAAPVGFFQRVGDRFHLRLILQTAHQRFQSLRSRCTAGSARGEVRCRAEDISTSSRKLPSSSSRIT